jgi:hypothetical protein
MTTTHLNSKEKRGKKGGKARSQQTDFHDHLRRMGKISAERNKETTRKRLIERNTGCFWWVNEKGETKKQKHSPGEKWQRGRKWK